MTSKRFKKVKNLYNSIVAMDFIKSAEEEDLEELEKSLMGGEIVEPSPKTKEKPETPTSVEEKLMGKPEVVKPTKQKPEPEEFISPEDLAKQLGYEEEIEKKEPVLPHRQTEPTLFGEVATSKLTPGAFKAKVCDICGSFNYPVWKKECLRCKNEYRRMLQDVDFRGYTPRKAIMIASQRSKGGEGRSYLGEDQLREIWDKEGHIGLPMETIDIQEELTDRRGLTGVPNQLKFRAILENQLNVVRVPKTVVDPKTGKEFKTTDVYYDPEGNPVPIKFSDRKYFGVFEIARRLQMSVSEVLKRISDYNAEHNLNPATDPNAIKPAVYIDELNQAFNWEDLEPLFKDRVKEVYEANIQTFLAKASSRWEYLNEKAEQLAMTRQVRQNNKEELLKDMADDPQKAKLSQLFQLRAENKKKTQRINKIKQQIEDARQKGQTPDKRLLKALEQQQTELNENLPERKILEDQVGKSLTNYENRMDEIKENFNRVVKAETRIKDSLKRLKSQINDYLTMLKDKVPSTLQDVARAQTGTYYSDVAGESFNINELEKDLKKETSLKLSKLHIKLAEEFEDKPLPGQLSFFPQFEEAEKQKQIEKQLDKPLTEEEKEKQEIKIKNIMMKSRLTQEEAEDRLEVMDHPLADPEGLSPKQQIERKKLIRKIMNEHPTREEAINRLEEMEAKPFQISKPRGFSEEEVKEISTEISDRICPHCGEKGFLKGSPICQKCSFTAPEGMTQVVVETVTFPLLRDKDGNPIPKTDEDGNFVIDERGNIAYKKRIQRQHSLVQIQIVNGQPAWATARKISTVAPDMGAKTKEEREQYFQSQKAQKPQVRLPKPISKKPDDFRPVKDEEGEIIGTEHKQKCKGCPEPWVKVKPERFDDYYTIENAVKFLKGEDLPRNIKAWKLEEVFSKPTAEYTPGPKTPTILETSRFDKIVKLTS